jgi:regulator of protease activity HflC (stomatin/prohibitin superfamily)
MRKIGVKIVLILTSLLVGLVGLIGLILLVSGNWISGGICFSVFVLIFIIFGLGGLKTAHHEERFVIEFLGRFFKIKGPGLFWICPFVMKVRAVVSLWEMSLKLFEEPVKIDFKDGSAIPKGVEAFMKIKSPDNKYIVLGESQEGEEGKKFSGVFRAIYFVDNWREKTTELLENAVRSYLATLTIDEALPQRRGGYDLLTQNKIPGQEKKRIKKTLEGWGLDLLRVAVTDFDLDTEVVQARQEVQKRLRQTEVAEFEKIVRSKETIGSLVQMISESTGREYKDIQNEINENPEFRKELTDFAKDMISRSTSLNKGALTDIRVSGAQGIEKGLLEIISLWKNSIGGGGQVSPPRKEEE